VTPTPEAFRAALAAHGTIKGACAALRVSKARIYAVPELHAVAIKHTAAHAAPAPVRLLPALLRRARESRGISQSALGRALDLAPSYVNTLESDDRAPQIHEGHLTRYAAALKMSLPELLAFASEQSTDDRTLDG
jgi:ribosome-binding protein aMBF1 (putative translation factor)